MFNRLWFVFWALLGLFIVVPILNTVVSTWTDDAGILDQVFNASDAAAWNATGEILTADQVAGIALTPFEEVATKFYVPIIAIFLVILIIYVLGKSRSNGGVKE